MKKLDKLLQKPWAAYTFAACAAVLLFVLLQNLPAVGKWLKDAVQFVSPVITGVAVAYLFNPVSDFFERKWLKKIKKDSARHVWGVALTLVLVVLVLALLLVALIPSIVQSVSKLIANWDSYTDKADELIKKAAAFFAERGLNVDLSNLESFVNDSMDKLFTLVKDNSKAIMSTLGSVGTSVSNFAVGVAFGFCFLVAKGSLLRLLGRIRAALFRKERIERNNELFRHCHEVFIRYIGCTLLDALIVGVATLVFTLAMGMPYAPLIAAMVAITNIIPTFGPMIGAAVGIFFLVLDKPLNALIFFIFICLLQSLDGMVIKPRLFKGSLGIPGVWTLVLIVLGGKVAGMLGILLSIPFAAIFVILYQQTIVPRLQRQAIRRNAGDAPEDLGLADD